MESFRNFADWISYISLAILAFSIISAGWLAGVGVLPALYRLGRGLSQRNVAIFAESSNQEMLQELLCDSRLFKKKNIIAVRNERDIGRAERATLYLVYWPDWSSSYSKIIEHKKDATALIVHVPPDHPDIPRAVTSELNLRRNVAINRFRGRLLSDIIFSMITTSYERK